MTDDYYQLDLPERRRRLVEAGFVRNYLRVWAHRDGRAVGEGVAAALTDVAFCRFLQIDLPALQSSEGTTAPAQQLRTKAATGVMEQEGGTR